MTDIDVSGCTRYCADTGKCTAFKSQYLCSERNNCYTKRILKKNKTINILKEKLLRKEQELEELQETIDDFITDNSSLYSYDGKQPSNLDELQECMQSSMNEFVKYKQALDEIEKLAKENVELLDGYHLEQANCLTILDIINKAKDGDNSE